MRSIQTTYAFSLSSVKPLETLETYRTFCITESRKTTGGGDSTVLRTKCPCCDKGLKSLGAVDGLEYVKCPECASFMLRTVAPAEEWGGLLRKVNDHKRSHHFAITASRNENVYLPKLEWIQNSLRLHDLSRPRVLEYATPPSSFFPLLSESGLFDEVLSMPESVPAKSVNSSASAGAAVLLESLDRSADPMALLQNVSSSLKKEGLLFVTSLVSSGFDISALGLKNLYIYPPDRTNCFSLGGLVNLLKRAGFALVEISTPGVLDVEIVGAHAIHDPSIPLGSFERQILESDQEKKEAFQTFLQENLMSSFARIVARLS